MSETSQTSEPKVRSSELLDADEAYEQAELEAAVAEAVRCYWMVESQ